MPSVVSITELYEGRRGSEDDRGRRQLTRVFRVRFDSIEVGISYAMYAEGLPLRYDRYEGPQEADEGSRAVRRSAAQESDDPFGWIVTIEYDSISSDPTIYSQGGGAGGQGGQPGNENPTLDPPDISWSASHDSIVLQKSFDTPVGKFPHTSAYEPFDPALTKDLHRPSLNYTRNEGTYDAAAISEYWDCVNDAPFAGFDKRQLKLSYTTGQKQYRNNQAYWRVTYVIEYRYPDWDHHVADKGTKAFNDSNIAVAVTKSGYPSGKVFLDGTGHPLDDLVLATNGPVILDFKAYYEIDFTILGLTGL